MAPFQYLCSAVELGVCVSRRYLRYNRLNEIALRRLDMEQISSLDGPLKATRQLSRLVWRLVGDARRVCQGLSLHTTAPDWPAASFNLRLSEILPGPLEDFGHSVWEDFR